MSSKLNINFKNISFLTIFNPVYPSKDKRELSLTNSEFLYFIRFKTEEVQFNLGSGRYNCDKFLIFSKDNFYLKSIHNIVKVETF